MIDRACDRVGAPMPARARARNAATEQRATMRGIALTSGFETDATAAALAGGSLADELHPRPVQRGDQLHQRIDVAPNDTLARFHALDGRDREAGQAGERTLIDAEEGARRSKLRSRNHV